MSALRALEKAVVARLSGLNEKTTRRVNGLQKRVAQEIIIAAGQAGHKAYDDVLRMLESGQVAVVSGEGGRGLAVVKGWR